MRDLRAQRGRRRHHRAVPPAIVRSTRRSTAGCTLTSSAGCASRARRSASARCSPARSSARATAPTSSGTPPRRASARSRTRRASPSGSQRMPVSIESATRVKNPARTRTTTGAALFATTRTTYGARWLMHEEPAVLSGSQPGDDGSTEVDLDEDARCGAVAGEPGDADRPDRATAHAAHDSCPDARGRGGGRAGRNALCPAVDGRSERREPAARAQHRRRPRDAGLRAHHGCRCRRGGGNAHQHSESDRCEERAHRSQYCASDVSGEGERRGRQRPAPSLLLLNRPDQGVSLLTCVRPVRERRARAAAAADRTGQVLRERAASGRCTRTRSRSSCRRSRRRRSRPSASAADRRRTPCSS